MSKTISKILLLIFLLNIISVVSFAGEDYISHWTMTTDKKTYLPGDYLILTIKNSNSINPFNGARIHFTFDENLLEYVTDFDELYNNIGAEPATLPGSASYGTCSGGMITNDGEFVDTIASVGLNLREAKDVYTVYFKIKKDIYGTHEVNFRWILNSKDYPSWVVQTVPGVSGDTETYLNVKFEDTSIVITGENMVEDNKMLSGSHSGSFSVKNDSENTLTEINGTATFISTDYAISFGRVVPRNNGVIKTKAGFLLSATNVDMNIQNKMLKNFEAVNFGSDNFFAGLFYGPGLKAGETYYVMPYVTYSDGITLYAPQATSFTMPGNKEDAQ